jgi:decaprenylphospho-beta-D-erythro-pentofuranosid-2-ulose 2-reductase
MSIRNLIVFGATSAIAQAALRVLVHRGASVFCVGRNADTLAAVIADLRVRAGDGQRIEGQAADLLDVAAHPALFEAARRALGPIDAVLVAHGTLPDQAACESSVERTLAAIAENGTSVVSLLTLAANEMAPQGRGVIAAISSVAGDRGRQSNYVYGASKSLVTTFLQGLRNRLASHGVRVVTVKPGLIETPMTAALPKGGPLWTSAEHAGRAVASALERGGDVVYVPRYWYLIMTILRHVPERFFKRLRL